MQTDFRRQPRDFVPLQARLQLRASVDRAIRQVFDDLGLLEVHVPSLVPVPGMEDHLDAFEVRSPSRASWAPRWLHTSPEFAIKEVFGALDCDIYCLARVYRDEPSGPHHSPEFTMLEWYRHGADYHVLMDDTEAIIGAVVEAVLGTRRPKIFGQESSLDLGGPFRRVRWAEAFGPFVDMDPLHADRDAWARALAAHGHFVDPAWDRETLISMLWCEVIEPTFGSEPVFLIEFPADQAALALLAPHDERVAERFELYVPGPWERAPGWGGIELANAFSELIDPVEQRNRFERCITRRQELGVPVFPMPEDMLAGLASMRTTAGIALGVDRLTTWIAQTFLGWNVSVYDFFCTRRREG